jgi:hypothetical protein
MIASLIQTAKLNDVEPFAYLRGVLERIVSGKTKANELASLLPLTSSDCCQQLRAWLRDHAYASPATR